MEIEQRICAGDSTGPSSPARLRAAQLVLVFGGGALLDDARIRTLRSEYPAASIVGCSTAGEIHGTRVLDDSLVVTAVHFAHTTVHAVSIKISGVLGCADVGRELARQLPREGLAHALVIADGLKTNGSELAAGLADILGPEVGVTGGLAGDGARFVQTLVIDGETAAPDRVVLLGLYGDRLRVGYGSMGGWDPFGPERLITRSRDNVLFELDGQSALSLYKRYLGPHAADLPATGLLFPLCLRRHPAERGLVRTILAVDEAAQSLTFAGDVPEGLFAQFMKANFERLIDGAHGAARASRVNLAGATTELALLISCVGRKLVLGERVEDEIDAVRSVLGDRAVLAGYYSYGELAPSAPSAPCELHNQTMTITTFAEN